MKRCENCTKMMRAQNCIMCYQNSLKYLDTFKTEIKSIVSKANKSVLKEKIIDFLDLEYNAKNILKNALENKLKKEK